MPIVFTITDPIFDASFACFSDRSETYQSKYGRQGRGGHRPAGVLSERGMGHTGSSGGTPQEVLSVLPRAVSRYILQHNPTSENFVLHGESHSAVRQHLLLISAGVLSTSRFRREDRAVHQHPAFPDYVLPADIRNYTIHIISAAIARQISALHDDSSRIIGRDNDYHTERALSEAEYS